MNNSSDVKVVIEKLTERLGNDAVQSVVPEKYLSDRTSALKGRADCIVIPRNTAEVSFIMKTCSGHGVSVTPRASGTGVTGGAVPSGGILLSMEKFNRIIEIDADNLCAAVEPCVITLDLNKAARDKGLFYPVDPGSQDESSIGGNVAENAGGMSAVKYGTTKDYLLGAEFVTPDGTVMNAGGKFVKNASGLNILAILSGSEGTLAVITKLVMRLVPLPGARRDILMKFDSLEHAADAVKRITSAHIVPTAIEFMERSAIELVSKHSGKEVPFGGADSLLLFRIDAGSDAELDRQEKAIVAAAGADEDSFMVARSEDESALLWSVRRGVRPAIEKESPVFLAEDCAVPRSEIPRFVRAVKKIFEEKNIDSLFFGHAGDGNVHIDILKRDIPDDRWKALLKELKPLIYKEALSCGGTITGEHGIGSLRKEYLPLQFTVEEIELMRRVKRAFDPEGILNPGKIF
jgi:glycolate oxidase